MATDAVSNNTGFANLDSSKSLQKFSKDFDNFLNLLTTQLKNQDPLSPMETHQFTTQLVQFSSVEQLIRQNTLTEAQIKNQAVDQALASLSLVGSAVEVPNPQTDVLAEIPVGGTDPEIRAKWRYKLSSDADKVTLTIKDSDGNVVRVLDGETDEGIHEIDVANGKGWDGKDTAGAFVSQGTYTLTVEALDVDGKPISNFVRGYGVVQSVDVTGDQPLMFVHGKGVNLSDVSRISSLSSY